jgi:hypothetical protein
MTRANDNREPTLKRTLQQMATHTGFGLLEFTLQRVFLVARFRCSVLEGGPTDLEQGNGRRTLKRELQRWAMQTGFLVLAAFAAVFFPRSVPATALLRLS